MVRKRTTPNRSRTSFEKARGSALARLREGLDLRWTPPSEHVFPKWLLNRYRLWDAQLTLLDGTSISYRKIKIPSCKTCNGVYLGALERRIEDAVRGGYEVFKRLPRGVVFQWLTKIFFQILYLEMRLAMDVRDLNRGTILTTEFLDEFRLEHALLNSVRVPVRVSSPPPWSCSSCRLRCQGRERRISISSTTSMDK